MVQSYSFSCYSKRANISFPEWSKESFYLVGIVTTVQKALRYLVEMQKIL